MGFQPTQQLPLSSARSDIEQGALLHLRFTLELDQLEIGVDPEKKFTFPMALGLMHGRGTRRLLSRVWYA